MKGLFLSLPILFLCSLSLFAESWPQFRGPDGGGRAPAEAVIPLEWGAAKNVKWKTALPGPGSSSPIFWGDRLFVTCYTGYGTDKKEIGDPEDLGRTLLCCDRHSGKVLWKASVKAENPEDPYRGYLTEHGYASSTPVTDGEHVYAFFGKSGVHAFTMEGKKLWSSPVGKRSSNRRWGSAASLVLHEGILVVNAGDEARALIGFDKKTGKERWRYQSENLEQSFGTPQVHRRKDGKVDLILSAPQECFGLDPATGERRWVAKTAVPGNVSPSVVIAGDRICAFGGYPRKTSFAIMTGGEGELKEAMLWQSKTTTYVPTPIAHGNHLYWVNDEAEAICMEVATGKVVTKKAVEGIEGTKRRSFYASTVLVGDKLVAVSRFNGTFVFGADPGLKQLFHNRLDDRSDFSGTPALAGDALYLRSGKFLYAIAK